MLTAFLKGRGVTLSEEKILITHVSDGFDFLRFNVRKYKGTLLIKPYAVEETITVMWYQKRCSTHLDVSLSGRKRKNVFWANFGLVSYQIIYSVEEQIKELGLTGVEKVAYRKANAEIAWQSLLLWCVFTVNDVLEKSQMHKVCNYVIHSSL